MTTSKHHIFDHYLANNKLWLFIIVWELNGRIWFGGDELQQFRTMLARKGCIVISQVYMRILFVVTKDIFRLHRSYR
jgi:hypothetical protein